MELLSQSPNLNKISLYNTASTLALVTIFYNIIEGLFSVFFGLEDETIALFGFGLDSFVEVISGIGIWHMVQRLKQFSSSSPDQFEKRALFGGLWLLLSPFLPCGCLSI
ncbi:MAG: hypothetical protein JRJ27_19775 [Deltaproteobacteria bacterium]|nr:hypothetical protein [Deltaproteobacteria bacterium]